MSQVLDTLRPRVSALSLWRLARLYLHYAGHVLGGEWNDVEFQAAVGRDELRNKILSSGGAHAHLRLTIFLFDASMICAMHPECDQAPLLARDSRPFEANLTYYQGERDPFGADEGYASALLKVLVLYGGRVEVTPLMSDGAAMATIVWEVAERWSTPMAAEAKARLGLEQRPTCAACINHRSARVCGEPAVAELPHPVLPPTPVCRRHHDELPEDLRQLCGTWALAYPERCSALSAARSPS